MKSVPILIIGKSGSGKSASLRNFKKEEIAIANVLGKPLPFKSDLELSDLAELQCISYENKDLFDTSKFPENKSCPYFFL